MERLVTNVQSLTDDLQHRQQLDHDAVIDRLFHEVSGVDELPKPLDSQLEECAIQLWNWAVTKHVATAITESQKAKVFHVACSLMHCSAPDNPPEGVVRKHILSLEILYNQLSFSRSCDLDAAKADVERTLLRVLSHQAESAISQRSQQEAVVCMQRCTDMLARLPRETGYLSLTCYNFGVELYNLKMFEESSFWLRQSYDVGKTNRKYGPGAEVQECMSAYGLHLKIRVLLRAGALDEAITAGKPLTPQSLDSLHLLLWDKASKHFKANNYLDALQWYNYSLSFYKAGQMEPNLARLQRNRASCLLLLKQLDKAKEALKEAERCDPDSIFTQFSLYKLAIQEKNIEKAGEALTAMGRLAKSPVSSEDRLLVCENAAGSLLRLAAQIALEVELVVDVVGRSTQVELVVDVVGRSTQVELVVDVVGRSTQVELVVDVVGRFTQVELVVRVVGRSTQVELVVDVVGRSTQVELVVDVVGRSTQVELVVDVVGRSTQVELVVKVVGRSTQVELVVDVVGRFTQVELVVDVVGRSTQVELVVDVVGRSTQVELVVDVVGRSTQVELAVEVMGRYIQVELRVEEGRSTQVELVVEVVGRSTQVELVVEVVGRSTQVELVVGVVGRSTQVELVVGVVGRSTQVELVVGVVGRSTQVELVVEVVNEEQDTAMKALESLCENSSAEAHALTALRCLVRLLLTTMETASDEESRALLMGQKTSLLMAVAASLQLCRESPHSVQTEELNKTLENIQLCTEVWKTLSTSGISNANDPTNKLLLLYEFEARVKLNDPKVDTVLESILELDNVETKDLENVAAHFPSLCKKVLRIALALHKKQPDEEPACRRQCVQRLIHLSLPSGVSEVDERVLEEVWVYYQEALCIIAAAAPEDIPEMESLWLLTRAWNIGILLFRLARYTEAERWCGLGMSFLPHLGSLQESYQTQVQEGASGPGVGMSALYGMVLDRLDRANHFLAGE
ncbi:hypothetical protein CRUP_029131 [Coryphaenoides rupestris]|nr:hypothetical protein CRUP_029131 [Coryphaenoides rupestris]